MEIECDSMGFMDSDMCLVDQGISERVPYVVCSQPQPSLSRSWAVKHRETPTILDMTAGCIERGSEV